MQRNNEQTNYGRKTAKGLQFPDIVWTVVSTLLILSLTLYPFAFQDPEHIRALPLFFKGIGDDGFLGLLSGTFIAPFQYETHKFKHFEPLANVFLFVPLGGSLAYLIHRLTGTWTATLILVSLTCLSFSLVVETLQVFLPSRSSTITDVVTNSMGGLFGFISAVLIHRVTGKN